MIPTVADHPRHLPRLQLRPGVPTAAGKGPTNGMGVGVGVGAGMGYRAASHTSLAEPGSEVSADTPGTLPWGQPGVMSSPNRYGVCLSAGHMWQLNMTGVSTAVSQVSQHLHGMLCLHVLTAYFCRW